MEIYYLSLNDYKNTSHNINFDMYKRTILHEYTYYVNRLFCIKNRCDFSIKYLSEGIATYLSKQKENKKLTFKYTTDDILNSNDCYDGWYMIVKYIIDKYPHNFIIELVKNGKKAHKFLLDEYENIKKYYRHC